jgi:hypothetical protein
MKRVAIIGAAIVFGVISALVMTGRTPAEPAPPPTLTHTTESSPAITTPVATKPAPAPAPVVAPPVPITLAEQTVELQLRLIDERRLDELRATFTPELRDRVTTETMEACRTRIHQVPVRPDWEMAENTRGPNGLRIRSVSMFGKSLTGFHEQRDGRWLADALWCVPVGLP